MIGTAANNNDAGRRSGALRLTEAEFKAALRDALRHYHRPDRLRGNVLMRSALVAAALTSDPVPAPTHALRDLIRRQCDELGDTPKVAPLKRVLELTYLKPMQGQQQVAEALHLSWSTYRRHLANAVQLLAAQLWEMEMAQAPPPVAGPTAVVASPERPPASRLPRTGWGRALAGLVASGLVGAIVWFLLPWDAAQTAATQTVPDRLTVAVLPFENLSADPANAYFAAGIQDEILTHLANITGLRVIARTSTERYQSHPEDLRTVATQLRVGSVLEGSVQKIGKRVSINVQLIDTGSLAHIWAKSYTRTLDDVFGVESEVAARVAQALDAKLNAREVARIAAPSTRNAAAYNFFLQGQYYADRAANGFLKSDFDAAIRNYRAAVTQDPAFALAWARLSITLSQQVIENTDQVNVEKLSANARDAAAKALQLAPGLAAAHMAQGWYRLYVLRDRKRAAASFTAALALQPNNAKALFTVGLIHEEAGALAESIQYLRKAIALDPRHSGYLVELVGVEDQAHDYAAAEKPALQAHAIAPDSLATVISLANVYKYSGDFKRAATVLDAAPETVRKNPFWKLQRVDLLFLQRDFAGAQKLLAGMKPGGLLPAYELEVYRGNAAWYVNGRERARVHYRRAETMIESLLKERPHSVFLNSNLAWIYARLGRTADASALAQAMIQHHLHAANVFMTMAAVANAAFVDAQIGKAEVVISELKRLYSMPHGDIISAAVMAHDPQWDPVRGDPRFAALIQQFAAQETLVPPRASVALK
ncbi:MAG TPA: tetratricopeptide repeat protein [Gammaproteobacteria bacterium]|nr:tetratricopeptide repeat protein [Gammaproteobacteria bacterium]